MLLTVDLLNLEHDWKKNGRKMNKSFSESIRSFHLLNEPNDTKKSVI